MNGMAQAQHLHGKNVAVIGGSKGLGRAIAAEAHAQGARVLAIAREEEPLERLTKDIPGIHTLSLDATHDTAPAQVFAALPPDILIVCAGATPHAAPLSEQSWEQFSRNWNSDVKMSLLFTQAALTAPLPPGAIIILISSGAAIGGSPLSGGYAGAKRTQMFMARYAQQESDRLHLGLRFFALVPGGVMPETAIGRTAVEAYAGALGISSKAYIERMPATMSTQEVGNAVIAFASTPDQSEGAVLMISAKGIEALP